MQFNSKGMVLTEDGSQIDFSLDMEMNRSFFSVKQEETLVRMFQERVNLTNPLVINFDGNAPELFDATFGLI
jgi:hypothetical protein